LLRRLPIFLMYGPAAKSGGRDNGLEYFQKTAPQHFSYLDPRMASSVLIYSAENFVWITEFWALKALLHEFAHAYQLEQWPEEQPDICAAWENARRLGLYHNVKDEHDKLIPEAYALVNQLEYFAECSCMYFVGCNYEPRDRAAFAAYDPAGHAMIRKVWKLE
jgi:hypothetical protein